MKIKVNSTKGRVKIKAPARTKAPQKTNRKRLA